MSATAGIIADGAFPNAAIPAGSDNTPAPTILFTRLNVRADIVPSPPELLPSLGFSIAAEAAAILSLDPPARTFNGITLDVFISFTAGTLFAGANAEAPAAIARNAIIALLLNTAMFTYLYRLLNLVSLLKVRLMNECYVQSTAV